MKTQQPILTTSILATGDIVADRFVSFAGAVPAAGADALGVAEVNCDIGLQASVNTHGILLVEAGAAIAVGASVECDASGRAITRNTGVALGKALDAATAAGQRIRIIR